MHDLFGRLVAPLAYLQVQHPSKRVYDYWLPLVGGTVATCCVLFIVRVNVFGEYGTVHGANQLLQILVGFYVASLAAVATFNSPLMDEYTAGDPLVLDDEVLTRRRFISLLFGHLALVGLLIYILGAGSMAVAPGLRDAVSGIVFHTPTFGADGLPSLTIEAASLMRGVFAWLHLCLSAHLLVATLYGVFFLAVRIHKIPKKPTATIPPKLKEAA